MQYVEIVRLVILALQLVAAIRRQGESADGALTIALDTVGKRFNIPELAQIAPEIKAIAELVRELRAGEAK